MYSQQQPIAPITEEGVKEIVASIAQITKLNEEIRAKQNNTQYEHKKIGGKRK
jgi:hypothetical protein